MISVVILTKNEEKDLPKCLMALSSFDDVHVLDSGSVDKTCEIATQASAKVWQNPFETFGHQRNWAIKNLPFEHDWILFLDADEVATEEFLLDLKRSVSSATHDIAGFYCCWKLILWNKWLRRCDSFPKWQFRVLRRGKAEFTDFGHGQKESNVSGKIGYIKTPYDHYAFSKGWSHWIDRHNRYSSQEAISRIAFDASWSKIFSKGANSERNLHIKAKFGRSSLFPILRFMVPYFFKAGFLEGKAGLVYCLNIGIYEYFVYLKILEKKRTEQ